MNTHCLPLALALALLVGPLGACGNPYIEPAGDSRAYRHAVGDAKRAIRRKRYDRAWDHVVDARNAAATRDELRVAGDLAHLLNGIDARRRGDARLARQEWAQIRDRSLLELVD